MPWEIQEPENFLLRGDWIHQRNQWLREYPALPGRFRIDLRLSYPRQRLVDVPVFRNPQQNVGYSTHRCYYVCDDWSTIFGVHDVYGFVNPTCQMIVENGNTEPLWGERLVLLSTGVSFTPMSWDGRSQNKFAYFREKFWRVTSYKFHLNRPVEVRYPFTSCWSVAHDHHDRLARNLDQAWDATFTQLETLNNFEENRRKYMQLNGFNKSFNSDFSVYKNGF